MLAEAATYRGGSAETVRSRHGCGDTLVRRHALTVNLVDGLSAFRDADAALGEGW